MSETSRTVTDEEMAAFLDGMLDEEDHARVAAALQQGGREFEIFAESLESLAEEERLERPPIPVQPLPSEPAAAQIVPFYKRPAVRNALKAIAASAAVAAIALVAYRALQPNASFTTAALLESLEANGSAELPLFEPSSTRGSSGDGAASSTREHDLLAFRTGVDLFDLRAAIRAGNRELTLDLIDRTARTLSESALPSPLIANLEELQTQVLDNDPFPAAALPVLDDLERNVRLLDEDGFAFGAWAEAVRVAVLSGRAETLERGALGKAARRLANDKPSTPRAYGTVEDIMALVQGEEAGAKLDDYLERTYGSR